VARPYSSEIVLKSIGMRNNSDKNSSSKYISVGATIVKPNKMSDVGWKNTMFSLNKKNNRSTGAVFYSMTETDREGLGDCSFSKCLHT